ncbi:hypothetical protein [Paraburkholderia youngii]|uniref:Uncharacterized protein n=1 Tax=Paraburkholderia youngii TaxID=2782701 RepID=A0A7Y6K0S5_9BURK|nr:hypothetical protein [Paraburkholderia youngii]NUY01434.1 hypothetical protein [Paraburkholderia youngii]
MSDVADELLERLLRELESPEITRTKRFVNKFAAHADNKAREDDPKPRPTVNDIESSLRILAQLYQFVIGPLLYDRSGTLVPTPQYDQIRSLDEPFVRTQQLDDARAVWKEEAACMDAWVAGDEIRYRFGAERAGKNKAGWQAGRRG